MIKLWIKLILFTTFASQARNNNSSSSNRLFPFLGGIIKYLGNHANFEICNPGGFYQKKKFKLFSLAAR
jgi:hypothetical protein